MSDLTPVVQYQFGGDAARQRAETRADELNRKHNTKAGRRGGYSVLTANEAKLPDNARVGETGVICSHVVVQYV